MGVIKFKVSRHSYLGIFSIVVSLCLGLFSQLAFAASTTSAQFSQYIQSICSVSSVPAGWDGAKVLDMCVKATAGGGAGSPMVINVSSNMGGAAEGSSLRKKKTIQELEEEQRKKSNKGASADGGGWGFLVSPQYGKSTRTETDLENGFQSTLSGLLVGLDYRFSDSFVLGTTVAHIKDDAMFLNADGSLKTNNNVFTIYTTWMPSENAAIDGYIGSGRIKLDSSRQVVFGTLISGVASGNTTGKQTLAGLSASFQQDVGRINVSPFINLDYIKTRLDGYSETGTSLMELHFGDRTTASFTSSLGVRLGSSYAYRWGMLLPSVRLATVHEFQNNSKQITNELVITSGTGMEVTTDSPDRNFLITGLGLVGALNNGTQLFLDFEKRSRDRLLSSWALSAGVLIGF